MQRYVVDWKPESLLNVVLFDDGAGYQWMQNVAWKQPPFDNESLKLQGISQIWLVMNLIYSLLNLLLADACCEFGG